MTIQDKIKHLQNMKAGKEPAEIEIIELIIDSLRILKNTFSNADSESVIISMSNHDYVLFEEFKAFKKFANQLDKNKDPLPEQIVAPKPEAVEEPILSETPETITV